MLQGSNPNTQPSRVWVKFTRNVLATRKLFLRDQQSTQNHVCRAIMSDIESERQVENPPGLRFRSESGLRSIRLNRP
jgi:hypothetical protein